MPSASCKCFKIVACDTFRISARESAEWKGYFSRFERIWISRKSTRGLPDRGSSCMSLRPCRTYWHQRWTLWRLEASSPNCAKSLVWISFVSTPSLKRKRMITLCPKSIWHDEIRHVHESRRKLVSFSGSLTTSDLGYSETEEVLLSRFNEMGISLWDLLDHPRHYLLTSRYWLMNPDPGIQLQCTKSYFLLDTFCPEGRFPCNRCETTENDIFRPLNQSQCISLIRTLRVEISPFEFISQTLLQQFPSLPFTFVQNHRMAFRIVYSNSTIVLKIRENPPAAENRPGLLPRETEIRNS
jgi:hypothetical protein